MNDTEQRYSQIEKECLAICQGFHKFETASDPTLSGLYRIISEGWPECRDNIPLALRPYWGYRDELSINNEAIYNGLAVLVPPSMVKHMLEKIHSNHLGGESNYRMARDVLFWPGMRKAIKDLCVSCDTCARYGTTAQKEPMQSLPIPTQAWDIVSQDLFSFEKEDYLVTVCISPTGLRWTSFLIHFRPL